MAVLETPALIRRKRDGEEMSRDELRALLAGYLAGEASEAQMAAFLMAGTIRGFTDAEAVALTELYVSSGEQIDLSTLPGPTVDKHSTGGVGDTTTLIVAPLAAACGMQVAKLSGRGLGHTGGTLDKLEAIPGFDVDRTAEQVLAQVRDVGVAVAAATADLVPLDKRLYALRDVTGSVSSPALIAASVMSKKLAGGAHHIVLDVKTGDGAFIEDVDEARHLAELCVRIGESQGRRTAAMLTDMSQPLGDAIGNALEVAAAVEVLQGGGDARLRELSIELVSALLVLTGQQPDLSSAVARTTQVLDEGAGLERFRDLVEAQGGEGQVADDPWGFLPTAGVVRTWKGLDGTVSSIACQRLGELAARLGAGRMRAGDHVDHAVGLVLHPRIGDVVTPEDPVVTIHARSEREADAVEEELAGVIAVTPESVPRRPLLLERIGFDDPTGTG